MKKEPSRSSVFHYRLSFILLTLGIYLLFFSQLLGTFYTHTTSPNDGPLIVWLIHQSAHYWTGQGDLYNWPIFHPYNYTATYSDPFLILGLLVIPIRFLTNNPVAQHNTLLLLSSFSTFVGMYLLAKELWKTTLIAWISAVFFTFSFLYLQFIIHLHTFFIAGIPLSLLLLIKYFKTHQLRYLILLAIAFLIQALNAPLTAYFTTTILVVYVLSENKLTYLMRDTHFQMTAFLTVAVCAWFYIPYFITADTFNAYRTINDAAHFSYSVTRLFWSDILLPSLLLLSALFIRESSAAKKILHSRTWILIALIGGLFMLGPVIKINDQTLKVFDIAIPLPYAIAYYVIPGISAFRAVTRWSIVLLFGLTLGLGWLLYNRPLKLRIIVILLASYLAIMLVLFQQNIKLFYINSIAPPIYEATKITEGEVIAEFPVTQWDMAPFDALEHHRLLYQLEHKKKLYNGVSGFTPQQRASDIHLHFKHFPDNQSLGTLKNDGVDLIIVHFDEYQRMAEIEFAYANHKAPHLEEILQSVQNQSQLQLITCTTIPFDCLYKVL